MANEEENKPTGSTGIFMEKTFYLCFKPGVGETELWSQFHLLCSLEVQTIFTNNIYM